MLCHRRLSNWLCNGILLLAAVTLLSLCLLNLFNPSLPALRCEGSAVLDPAISHPYRGETVRTVYLFAVVLILPYIQIVVTELFYNQEVSHGQYAFRSPGPSRWKRALLYSSRWYRDYLFGAIFVMFLNDIAKITMSAPRPHFIDTCRPNFTKSACVMGWVDNYECSNTGVSSWKMADARKSFPSGHAAASMFSAIFMVMYQHHRISASRHGNVVVLWCHLSWLAWGVFCSLSRVTDHRHHPIDIAVGGILGVLGAAFTAVFLCKNFSEKLNMEPYEKDDPYGHQSSNGSATVIEGFERSSTAAVMGSAELNGGARLVNGDPNKRPSLRRLLSAQSTVTQMSDIVEDREMDQI